MCGQIRRCACIAERQQSDAACHILIHAMVIHSRWQRVFTAPSSCSTCLLFLPRYCRQRHSCKQVNQTNSALRQQFGTISRYKPCASCWHILQRYMHASLLSCCVFGHGAPVSPQCKWSRCYPHVQIHMLMNCCRSLRAVFQNMTMASSA